MANIQIVRDRFHAKYLIITKWKRDHGKGKIIQISKMKFAITLQMGDGFSQEC